MTLGQGYSKSNEFVPDYLQPFCKIS